MSARIIMSTEHGSSVVQSVRNRLEADCYLAASASVHGRIRMQAVSTYPVVRRSFRRPSARRANKQTAAPVNTINTNKTCTGVLIK